MSKQVKVLAVLAAIVFVLGIVGTWVVLRPSQQRLVEIVQDGTVLYTIDLETADDQEIVITSADGKTNTVTIENGEIFISHAECPDQTCVKSGVLYSESLPIVCLPNKLIIRFR